MKTVTMSLLLLLLLFAMGYAFLRKSNTFTQENWVGNWEITYVYDNEKNLQYTGSLHLTFEDSLSGSLKVFAPKSIRPENLAIKSITASNNFVYIRGLIVHNAYKIKGGYLTETFEFKLENEGSFSGSGQCIASCAEGTEEVPISWSGKRQ